MPRYPTKISSKKIHYYKPKISESTFEPGHAGSQKGVSDCYGEPVRYRSKWKKRKDRRRNNKQSSKSNVYPKFTGYKLEEKKYEWIENRIGERLLGWIHPKYHYTIWKTKDTPTPEPFVRKEFVTARFKK